MTEFKGRRIYKGKVEGFALVTTVDISFYGGVDPETGEVVEKDHPLEGKSVAGKVLVMPSGKGSTVGLTGIPSSTPAACKCFSVKPRLSAVMMPTFPPGPSI